MGFGLLVLKPSCNLLVLRPVLGGAHLPPRGWQWHFLLLHFLYGLFNFSVVVSKDMLEDDIYKSL